MKIVNIKNLTEEIDDLLNKMKNEIIIEESLSSKNAEEKANNILFKLLEDALDKYTTDLFNGKEKGTYIVSHNSIDMFAKLTLKDLEHFGDLWK